jgi:hypothetical protein
MCSGGGSGTDNGQQLNLSIGGTPIVGSVAAGGGEQITFSVFSSNSY